MHPIGIFDSGYGGLTVFKPIAEQLPDYDYIYLGDNGRAPYGNRSFETVYQYTLECVTWFFEQGCELVILACNTASAKALRTIQQHDLPALGFEKRVLGVIRPSAEIIGRFSITKNVGILGTKGTVNSMSYRDEIAHFFPELKVFQHACPLWVPFVENGAYQQDGIDFFIQEDMEQLFSQSQDIDTVLLACTHYPLLESKIRKFLPENVQLLSQGPIVANSLSDYLMRHPEMESRISRSRHRSFYTTDAVGDFETHARVFFGQPVRAKQIFLNKASKHSGS
jgi:glutamate racemase